MGGYRVGMGTWGCGGCGEMWGHGGVGGVGYMGGYRVGYGAMSGVGTWGCGGQQDFGVEDNGDRWVAMRAMGDMGTAGLVAGGQSGPHGYRWVPIGTAGGGLWGQTPCRGSGGDLGTSWGQWGQTGPYEGNGTPWSRDTAPPPPPRRKGRWTGWRLWGTGKFFWAENRPSRHQPLPFIPRTVPPPSPLPPPHRGSPPHRGPPPIAVPPPISHPPPPSRFPPHRGSPPPMAPYGHSSSCGRSRSSP